jgi:hypothetical protein
MCHVMPCHISKYEKYHQHFDTPTSPMPNQFESLDCLPQADQVSMSNMNGIQVCLTYIIAFALFIWSLNNINFPAKTLEGGVGS